MCPTKFPSVWSLLQRCSHLLNRQFLWVTTPGIKVVGSLAKAAGFLTAVRLGLARISRRADGATYTSHLIYSARGLVWSGRGEEGVPSQGSENECVVSTATHRQRQWLQSARTLLREVGLLCCSPHRPSDEGLCHTTMAGDKMLLPAPSPCWK